MRNIPRTVKSKIQFCFNCGLPEAKYRSPIHHRNGNQFRPDSTRTEWFCSEECAAQSAYLGLETRSTLDSVVRLLGGKPISYAEFRKAVPVEIEAAVMVGCEFEPCRV